MSDLTTLELAHPDAFAFAQSTSFDDLPDAAKAHIDRKFLEQHYLQYRQHEFRKLNFDRDTAVDVWFETFTSPHTLRRYTTGLREFFGFLDDVVKVHILDLNAEIVDRYVAYVGRRFGASATQHSYLNIASAFCKQLVRRGDLAANYFSGAKRPENKDVKVYYVPREFEIDAILDLAARSRSAWRVPALRFMLRTGCRVGLLETLKLDEGIWIGRTKGKDWTRPYVEEDANLVEYLPIPAETFRKAFDRMVRALRKEKKVARQFSIHDLRHFCAVREYRRTLDIEHVRIFLGHASINTTQRYLRDDLRIEDV